MEMSSFEARSFPERKTPSSSITSFGKLKDTGGVKPSFSLRPLKYLTLIAASLLPFQTVHADSSFSENINSKNIFYDNFKKDNDQFSIGDSDIFSPQKIKDSLEKTLYDLGDTDLRDTFESHGINFENLKIGFPELVKFGRELKKAPKNIEFDLGTSWKFIENNPRIKEQVKTAFWQGNTEEFGILLEKNFELSPESRDYIQNLSSLFLDVRTSFERFRENSQYDVIRSGDFTLANIRTGLRTINEDLLIPVIGEGISISLPSSGAAPLLACFGNECRFGSLEGLYPSIASYLQSKLNFGSFNFNLGVSSDYETSMAVHSAQNDFRRRSNKDPKDSSSNWINFINSSNFVVTEIGTSFSSNRDSKLGNVQLNIEHYSLEPKINYEQFSTLEEKKTYEGINAEISYQIGKNFPSDESSTNISFQSSLNMGTLLNLKKDSEKKDSLGLRGFNFKTHLSLEQIFQTSYGTFKAYHSRGLAPAIPHKKVEGESSSSRIIPLVTSAISYSGPLQVLGNKGSLYVSHFEDKAGENSVQSNEIGVTFFGNRIMYGILIREQQINSSFNDINKVNSIVFTGQSGPNFGIETEVSKDAAFVNGRFIF